MNIMNYNLLADNTQMNRMMAEDAGAPELNSMTAYRNTSARSKKSRAQKKMNVRTTSIFDSMDENRNYAAFELIPHVAI